MDVFGEIRGRRRTALAAARPRFPDLPIINPGEVPAAAAGPGPQPAGEIRRALLSRDRRDPAPARAGRLVRPRPLEQPGHLGGRLRAATTRSVRRPIGSTRRCGSPRNPRLDDGPRMEMACRRTCPSWRVTCWPSRCRPSRWRATRGPTRCPWRGARAGPTGSGCCWRDGWPTARAAGYDVPREALDELRRHSDPMIGLWATYSLAVLPRTGPDPALTAELEKAARAAGPDRRAGRAIARRAARPARSGSENDASTRPPNGSAAITPRRPRSGGAGRFAIDRWCGKVDHRAWDRSISVPARPATDPAPITR